MTAAPEVMVNDHINEVGKEVNQVSSEEALNSSSTEKATADKQESIGQLIIRKRSTKRKRPAMKKVVNLKDFISDIPLSEASKSIEERVNEHNTGFWMFQRAVPFEQTICFSKKVIKNPLLKKVTKELKKKSVTMFKMINEYMQISDANVNSQDENSLAIPKEILHVCFKNTLLRDEFYLQVMKQMNGNDMDESKLKGLMLMAMGMIVFVPSSAIEKYLQVFIGSCINTDLSNITGVQKEINEYAVFCIKRYRRLNVVGLKRGMPPSTDEIKHALHEVKNPSVFGNSLKDVYSLQEGIEGKKEFLLPWFLPKLSKMIIDLGGFRTEGIFRVPGDVDEVNALKISIDKNNILTDIKDPNVPGSLLKLWFRELSDPIVPPTHYDECLQVCNNPQKCIKVLDKLPDDNKIIIYFIINFLQKFINPETIEATRMNTENIAMVWSPNFVRCPQEDPMKILEMNQKEKAFVGNLVAHLKTDEVQDEVTKINN